MKINLIFTLSFWLSTISFQSGAQTISAGQAYDSVQLVRGKAVNIWRNTNSSAADVFESIHNLKNILLFLESPPIFELEEGNIYLEGRKHDICFDLASAYAIAGEKDSAISYLEKMFAQGSSQWMLQSFYGDSVFMPLRADPRFITIANKLKSQDDLYYGTAFKTPYKPELTDDEKIAGLSLLWSQAKYNFVYFDHVNIDWNKSYIEYLSKVKAAKTTAQYYKILQRFYAQLKDGHTNVYPPEEISKDFYSRPPMRTELIDGRVFVKLVFSDSLKKEGINPGVEILKIDSQNVVSYAEKYVAPYQSSSTPQDMEIREYSYALLSGPEKTPVILELKDRNGRIFTKTIARSGYSDIKAQNALEFQTIGNIGYLTLNNFEDRKIIKQFDSLFTTISQTKGLIIDIRFNGGGSDEIGFHILKKLTGRPFKGPSSKMLKYISRPGWEVNWYKDSQDDINPDGNPFYSKPIVLLVGARTFSAAEDYAAAFKFMKRGKLIGQPTGGSTGQPISFDLPGGGTARICAKRDFYPDGKEFVGIGIIPDIPITPSIEDLENGNDTVRNKALQLLKGSF